MVDIKNKQTNKKTNKQTKQEEDDSTCNCLLWQYYGIQQLYFLNLNFSEFIRLHCDPDYSNLGSTVIFIFCSLEGNISHRKRIYAHGIFVEHSHEIFPVYSGKVPHEIQENIPK